MVSWLTVDVIYCLVLLCLVGIIIFQHINHAKVQSDLLNRLMAKNFGELVQSQVLVSENKKSDMIQLKLPEEDYDPNGVDMLNKIL